MTHNKYIYIHTHMGFPSASVVKKKNPPAIQETRRRHEFNSSVRKIA